MNPRPKRLPDQVREAIQRKHYAASTGRSYANWIKRFILFHGKLQHPRDAAAWQKDEATGPHRGVTAK